MSTYTLAPTGAHPATAYLGSTGIAEVALEYSKGGLPASCAPFQKTIIGVYHVVRSIKIIFTIWIY
jgi:hypothetical protein